MTRTRLYLETMENVLANPDLENIIIDSKAAGGVVPYLPLDKLPRAQASGQGAPAAQTTGGKQ